MPSWNGDWVSWRTSQGSARIVTWLPTVEIDEPAQKRRNVPSRRTDGSSFAARVFRGGGPARPTVRGQAVRIQEAAPPALGGVQNTRRASCRRAAPRGAVGVARRREDRGVGR